MKILIATDMEGITGVTTWDQVTPGHAEYARFRRLMTQDVNAAIRGAFDAGARRITENMKVAAAHAIASVVGDELRPDFIIPSVFDTRVVSAVAEASRVAAIADGVCRPL